MRDQRPVILSPLDVVALTTRTRKAIVEAAKAQKRREQIQSRVKELEQPTEGETAAEAITRQQCREVLNRLV